MQRSFPILVSLSSLFALGSCNDINLGTDNDGGGGMHGTGGGGSGGALAAGGAGSGGALGTGGTGTGGTLGTGGTEHDAGVADATVPSDGSTPTVDAPVACSENGVTYPVGATIPRSGDNCQTSCQCLEGGIIGRCTGACPLLDSGQDLPIPPGCDLTIASQAIAALGLTTVGSAQAVDATLSATLTDDNWGTKAMACQQGGYDITPLAGQTVCLVGQSITQACAAAPSTVWVVMTGGAVRCVYESALSNGGIYPVNTSNCSVAAGCDLDVASNALAGLGLTSDGSSQQTLNATLPATLTDANWGLKASVCQQGGYDITPLAGQTVCLVEQNIVQACSAAPGTAWVLMSDGAVKCVYESSNASLPGIYAVNNSLCP